MLIFNLKKKDSDVTFRNCVMAELNKIFTLATGDSRSLIGQ
jgi:hypothetical protein